MEFPQTFSHPENSPRNGNVRAPRAQQLRLVSISVCEVSAPPKQKPEEAADARRGPHRPPCVPHNVASSFQTDGARTAEVFLGSFPDVSRDLGFLSVPCQIQIQAGQGQELGLQAPLFTPHVIVSFLSETSHLKTESSFSSQRWTGVTFSWRGNPTLAERCEGEGNRGGKVVPCEGWKWSLGKTGINTLLTVCERGDLKHVSPVRSDHRRTFNMFLNNTAPPQKPPGPSGSPGGSDRSSRAEGHRNVMCFSCLCFRGTFRGVFWLLLESVTVRLLKPAPRWPPPSPRRSFHALPEVLCNYGDVDEV